MLSRGHLWRGQRVCWSGLRGLGRYPAGVRIGPIRHRHWQSDAPLKPTPPRQPLRKGLSGLRQWSLMVLLLGQEARGEVLGHAREIARYLLCTVARQSEVHTSQKLRRTLQLYSAYSRLWGEEAARNMLVSLRRTLASKGRHLLLSAVCFSNFNWDQEKISDERLQESAKHLESVGDLCQATVECDTCGKRQVIDQKMVNVDYCMCDGSLGYTSDTREYESWHPFIEREHHIVWRQRHPKHSHLFAYKVYGRYDDVSLSSFMETQLNSDYRTEWDDTALQLKVMSSHEDSNSDLVYWLVKFPHFFANRDYVFKRRFIVDSEKREVVIMSEAVCPEVMPEEKGIHRVNEYWSTMVIRALGDMDQPGIEYTLTYFDNPGTSLPQSITNFIAVTGFPNFLKKLHMAALQLQSFYEKGEDVYVSLPPMLRFPERWRKELEELPEPEVLSREELEVIPKPSEAAVVEDDSLKTLIEEDVPGESQEEIPEIVSLPVMSVVMEETNAEAETPDKKTSVQEELSITSTPHEIDMHIEGSSVSDEKTTSSLSSDAPKKTTSDKSLHVDIGGRKVSIDLLEAMEVVAPDLEKKSLLLRKIEELNEKLLKGNGGQNALLLKLQKVRHKLKSFHQKASMRREQSIKQMEQFSNRDHYHHMNIDDKTLTQLEMLFEAMNYVLQADKDMRTGKTLLGKGPAAHHKAEVEKCSPEGSQPEVMPGLSSSHAEGANDEPPERDEPGTAPKSKMTKKMKKKKTHKESPPPENPPPPDSSGGKWHEEETRDNADEINSSAGNFASELGNIAKSVHNVNSQEEEESRSWFSGVSVPYISTWWVDGPRQENCSSTHQPDAIKPEHNAVSDLDAQTNTLLSQIFYMFTLRWIFYSENDEHKSVKSVHSQEGSENDESERSSEAHWYWYPVNGAYRVYAWMFSASRVSA
ncbi:StAR-related lipid transfer protein 7, mitochondrial [Portunus trituberculatus]|uniref:Phosphatidylcholine transfer protein n=1 Tax=Portunus trituberculatus TaxID=210409 RepID=A0A5B7DYY5_PORTR|nr:StAR-related lipid transfer protein 7, mitochondrial [Portunus trituberculatus]